MATVFCFSSTGNSLYVAKEIAAAINGSVVSMKPSTKTCNDTIIGFVFPTYFWGLPKTVESFMKELLIENKNAYIFAITTFGGSVKNLDYSISKILKEKQLVLHYFAKIRSIENYTIGYKVNETEKIYNQVDQKLRSIIADLLAKKHTKISSHNFPNSIIYRAYPANKKTACDSFFVVENCTSCGICAQSCSRHNISIENGKPIFHGDCELCLACLHGCPQEAINWKKKTKGKQRYLNRHITKAELLKFIQS